MNRHTSTAARSCIAITVALALIPVLSWAWTPEVIEAFEAVASGAAAPGSYQHSLALKNNGALNEMRVTGNIPQSTFEANQNQFDNFVKDQMGSAAGKNGLKVKTQAPMPGKSGPSAGGDTDGIVEPAKPGETVTPKQVSKTRSDFKKGVSEYFKNHGVGEGPPPDMNTSFLPDPKHTKPGDFKAIVEEAKAMGEVVYQDPAAAACEAKIRDGKPIEMGEANARVNEVQNLAKEHFTKADDLIKQAAKHPPGSPARNALEAQAQIQQHLGAKQIQRITQTGEYLAGQNGLEPVGAEGPAAGKVKSAAIRGETTALDAAITSGMRDQNLAKATEAFVKNAANVAAKNPGMAGQCQQGIATALGKLPPAQQGQMLESLRNTHGDMFAVNVAKQMRANRPPPAGPGLGAKVLKVIGPIMILADGTMRIYDTATSKDPSYEAGKNLGGFSGGMAGAAAGGLAGAKAGGVAGGMIAGPIGATIGGILGGLYGGYKGYQYGSGVGTEMGDTNSKYWDKNLPQTEFNKRVMAGQLASPDDIYSKLIAMGVPPDRAKAATDLYKSGSLATFAKTLKGLREEMIRTSKWGKGFRRFNDLPTNEVQQILDCLCSASLGANPWVAQGYNLNIPPDADPKRHSCGSLANGPCMAQGFGCWRSFMKLGSKEAMECVEAAGLPPTQWTMREINNKFQQQYEKPFEVDFDVSPLQVCPGDQVNVSVSSRGGQGGHQFQYEIGAHLLPPKGKTALSYWEPSSTRGFTLTVDPTLIRAQQADGQWVYTRPAEAYNTYVRVLAHSDTGVGGDGRRLQVHKILTVTIRAHDECMKLHPPPKKEDPKKAPPKKVPGVPVVGPKTGTHVDTPSGDDEPETGGQTITRPPPTGKGSGGDDEEGGDDASAPGGKGKGGKTKSGKWTPKGTSEAPGPDDQIHPDYPDGKGPGGTDDGTDCSFNGGGTSTDGGPATIFAEVPAGQRIRMTITGSDGFSQTIEGVGHVEVSRPLNPNGSDTIKLENLDRPECVDEQTVPYDAMGSPIMGPPGGLETAEPTLGPVTGVAPTSTVDRYTGAVGAANQKKTQDGLTSMGAATAINEASQAGHDQLDQAKGIRDAAGAQAQGIRDQSVRDAAAKDAKNSWGNVLGDAIANGVEQGVSSFGSAFGSAAAGHVSSEIFDSGHKEDTSDDESTEGESATTAAGAPKSSSGSSGHDKGKSDGKKTKDSGHEEEQEMDSITCDFCGYTMKFPKGTKPDSNCPKCGCGPDKDLCTCSVCGHQWFVPSGHPTPCPNCSEGTKIEPDDEGAEDSGGSSSSGDSGSDSSAAEPAVSEPEPAEAAP